MTKTLVVIGGPTASGKTRVAVDLAKKYNSEIISADSRQIYKETSIGTAVPSPEELSEVKHHFIQFLSLKDYYNASIYEIDVIKKLEGLFQKRDIIFMAGGSGLYINAVCFGIDDIPSIDQSIRTKLERKYKEEGLTKIQLLLKELDPISYERVDLNNHLRILKALEVSMQTGKPYSSFLTNKKRNRDFQVLRIGLDMNRTLLYDKINSRVFNMIQSGLVDEVKSLSNFRDMNAMKTVGYREIFRHLDGDISLEDAVDLIQRNTRKYARKQLTWFRKDNLFSWFEPGNSEGMVRYIEDNLS